MALAFLALVVLLSTGNGNACSSEEKSIAMFNFGDSNSDTGGLVAGLGLQYLQPNGMVFFHRPNGRYCDGRLLIDFICASMGAPFLSAYLDSVATEFTNGSNFACAGSTVNRSATTFPLHVQVNQFIRFKTRVLQVLSQHNPRQRNPGGLPPAEAFQRALYTIDIGQNDITRAMGTNLSESEIISQLLPPIISEIKAEMRRLYDEGARRFVVHNTGPLGCLPRTLTNIRRDLAGDIDQAGCAAAYNRACKAFNALLKELCVDLRSQLPGFSVSHVDIFSIKYSLVANASRYGFQKPLAACCGYGGLPYNYRENLRCGESGSVNGKVVSAEACDDPSKSISWDGIHYSEAANALVASQVLSGAFSDPPGSPYC